MKKKIIIVAGTRPEIIKVAPLYLALKKEKAFDTKLLFTGQHVDLAKELWKLFDIEPDTVLYIQKKSTLNKILSDLISQSNFETKPSLVIVQGDTTSALAIALSAYYQKIPVAHLEAGLRTWDNENPYPEEANRRMIDSFAQLLFAPTMLSKENLKQEKCPGNCFITGNTVVDAVNFIKKKIGLTPFYEWNYSVLWTMHRRESHGKYFNGMVQALKTLSKKFPGIDWYFPMHPSPAVREPVKILNGIDNIHLIEPLNYPMLLNHIWNSLLIVSDSGGIQEEAVTLKKHCLIMRDKTERPEALSTGWCHLIGRQKENIVSCVSRALDLKNKLKPGIELNPFGDGNASYNCIDAIKSFFKYRS